MHAKRLKREYEATTLRRREPASEFLQAFKKSKLHEGQIMPEGPDFCNLDIVREILLQPVDVVVNANSFDDILPILPSALAQWREGLRRDMLELIKRHDRTQQIVYLECGDDGTYYDALAPALRLSEQEYARELELATTVFRCSSCSWTPVLSLVDYEDDDYSRTNTLLFYPQVLGHQCLTRESLGYWDSLHDNDYTRRLSNEQFVSRTCWGRKGLAVDSVASKVAKKFVQMAGLDPLTATVHDMDCLDLRFSCLICIKSPAKSKPARVVSDNSGAVVPLLTWRAAVCLRTSVLHQQY
jgi:hypothetical protein